MRYIKIKAFLLLSIIFSLSSCLKEGNMNIDTSKGPKNVVEFANTGDNIAGNSSTYPEFHLDMGVLLPGQSFIFNVNGSYSGADVAPTDITLNFELDQAALDTFNIQNETEYEIPPVEIYEMPKTLVIKKGTHLGQIQVKITNNSSYDYNASYALPLKISSATMGTISSNFGKAIYSFGLRNIYDGHYKVTALSPMADEAVPGLTGKYPMDVYLVTTGANSVAMYDNNVSGGSFAHSILNGGSSSSYGSFSPVFNFNSSGDGTITSVVNYYGQPSTNGRSGELDVSATNKWIEGESMDVKYWMNQPGATHRTSFNERFTYLGPR